MPIAISQVQVPNPAAKRLAQCGSCQPRNLANTSFEIPISKKLPKTFLIQLQLINVLESSCILTRENKVDVDACIACATYLLTYVCCVQL